MVLKHFNAKVSSPSQNKCALVVGETLPFSCAKLQQVIRTLDQ